MGRYEHIDRKSPRRGNNNSSGNTKGHDLFLKVEDGSSNGNGNGGQSPSGLSSSADHYDGLELEQILDQRIKRKRYTTYMMISIFICLIAIGILYVQRGGHSSSTGIATNSTANTSPGGPDTTVTIIDNDDDETTTTTTTTKTKQPTKSSSTTSKAPSPTITLWPTSSPQPSFKICKPPLISDKPKLHSGLDVFHIHEIRIIPESPTKDDYEDEWEYTFSDMDISDDASIIAIGMSDYSESTEYDVGLVRVYAYSCSYKTYKQLGQDLLGMNEYEQYGHRVSTSKDGQVMAISAPQDDIDSEDGFVDVYYLEDNTQKWILLGNRIDDLNLPSYKNYYSLGHSIDLSNKGETLAVMAILDDYSNGDIKFIMRVYQYDSEDKNDWIQKGHDLTLTISTASDDDYDPQLSLNDDGDELSISDPSLGVVTYEFHFESNKWKKRSTNKQATFTQEDDDELEEYWWIESMDMDNAGNVVAYSAFYEDDTIDVDTQDEDWVLEMTAKVYDYTNDTANELYAVSYKDYNVALSVAISDKGNVAAVVAARYDIDDSNTWNGDYIGSMTIIAKKEQEDKDNDNESSTSGRGGGDWYVVGKGTNAENLGVPGNVVTLSGDGQIAAVGSDDVVALYGIILNNNEKKNADNDNTDTTTTTTTTKASPLDLCLPYPDGTANSHVGDIDDLPKQEDEHTLSLAMSTNGTVVAVGIDQYDGEDRGLVRVFGWDCTSQSYEQVGQDLFGDNEFDGFGQSVDLSSDGMTLVVGANQPPPGKSGYVDVYKYDDGHTGQWKLLGHRLDNVKNTVYDIGREVRISDDGNIIMFSGSIEMSDEEDFEESASFIRVVENVDGEWKNKGEDLISSIEYDEFGTETHISLASGSNNGEGDIVTLGVTGSYSAFVAKIYEWDASKNNWTESIIPPLTSSSNSNDNNDEDDGEGLNDDGETDDMYYWDTYYDNYFSGSDIALNDNGNYVAIAGTKIIDEEYEAVVRVLTRPDDASSDWTLSHDPIDYTNDYSPNSVSISADGQSLAVGINTNNSSKSDQGALFVVSSEDDDSSSSSSSASGIMPLNNFISLGKVDGRNENDLLGSRVRITRDGKFAAASSHKGYISFFKIG